MKVLVRNPATDMFEILEKHEQYEALRDKVKEWAEDSNAVASFWPKFVVASKDGENHMALFGSDFDHDEIAKSLKDDFGYGFVAAGKWLISPIKSEMYYGSMTCKKIFDFDQPRDKRQAEILLAELKQTLADFLKACK